MELINIYDTFQVGNIIDHEGSKKKIIKIHEATDTKLYDLKSLGDEKIDYRVKELNRIELNSEIIELLGFEKVESNDFKIQGAITFSRRNLFWRDHCWYEEQDRGEFDVRRKKYIEYSPMYYHQEKYEGKKYFVRFLHNLQNFLSEHTNCEPINFQEILKFK